MAKTTVRGAQIADGANGVNLTVDVTGVLPVANGGTGANTAAGAITNLGAVDTTNNQSIGGLKTFTGTDGIVAFNAGGAQIIAASAAGAESKINFRAGAVTNKTRWELTKNTTAESGSNAGSDMDLNAFDDSGTFLARIFRAIRSTGILDFTSRPTVGGTQVALISDLPGGGGGGGGGSGNVTYVAQGVVSGSAATTLTVSGLDLTTDQEYLVVIDMKNAAGSTSQMSLYYNGDTTDANYKRSYGTNIGNGAENNARIGGFTASEIGYIEAKLRLDLNGRPALMFTGHRSTTTPTVLSQYQSTYWTTIANVTQLTLSSSVASGLAVGTKMTVYKRAH